MTAAPASGVCGRCAEPVEDTHRFCEACGFDLQRVPDGAALDTEPGPTPCPACGAAAGVEPGGFCDDCGVRRPEPRVVSDLGAMAGVSDRGKVHANNEDAIALGGLRDGVLAAVVCDGVSSTVRPERAARAAADTALEGLLAPGPLAGADRVRAAVRNAARAVDALGGGPTGPSCTLVAGLVEPASDGSAVTVGWIGDSRAYWLDDTPDGGRALTTDHSWAAEVVAAGLRDAADAERDPRAHAITRWLGPDADVDEPDDEHRGVPDVVTLDATAPGTLLLCSDGLWNYVPEADGLGVVVRDAGSPLAAAQALCTVALDAGGRDNVSVVVVPVGATATPGSEGGTSR